MPDPTDNDPWADLYADLGVTEKSHRPAAARPAEEYAPADESAPANDAEGDDDEGDDDEGDGQPAGEGGEPGEDGTPKKRRRRRRRGKKKPGEETPAGATATGFDESGDGDEMPEYGRNAAPPARAAQPAEPQRRPVASARPPVDIIDDESGFGAGVEGESADHGDGGGEPIETHGGDASLEGATTEMTRELLANWNVPSWEELVRGLQRPNH
jgi:hypothetical protein